MIFFLNIKLGQTWLKLSRLSLFLDLIVAVQISILVRTESVRCPWLLAEMKVATIFSELIFFLLPPLFKTREGMVEVLQIFAWAPRK
jgi:membrane-associated PAP2 superfamily phosphatase